MRRATLRTRKLARTMTPDVTFRSECPQEGNVRADVYDGAGAGVNVS